MVRRVVVAALAVIVGVGLVPAGSAPVHAEEPPPEVTCPATLPGPRAVVQLAYVVLLRRCPDPAGAAAWETALRDGLATETFARRITATPEARGVVVTDAYRTVLDRDPSAADRAFWADWLRPDPRRVRRHDQLIAELAASAELYAAAGRDDATFVGLVYERILERPASAADEEYWSQRLAASDRRTVARDLVRLTEPLGAEVTRAWLQILDARPNAAQRAREVARLRADGDRLGLAARLVGSAAFDARAQAGALVVPGRYVALGDSYVVGEGNGPDVETDLERCPWSTAGYPEQARTTSERVPSDLAMAACSGATLLDLYPYVDAEDDRTYPGQIDLLTEGEAPSLVTLTIGGNDMGFVPIVESCLQIQVDRQGQFSPFYDAEQCDQWLEEEGPAALDALRTGLGDIGFPDGGGYQCTDPCSLTSALEDVMEAAPEAEVLVVGYPPLMPPVATGCRGTVSVEQRPSPGVEWYFAPRDVRRGRAIIAALNDVLRDAAEATGATYVDPGPRFAGHEVCSAEPWIHGLDLVPGFFPHPRSFHPNRRGGVGVAAAVIDALED